MRIPLNNNDGKAKTTNVIMNKARFTAVLGAVLFRLYYESTISKDGMAYGLKHNELLSGFSAIGRLEYHFTEIGNN